MKNSTIKTNLFRVRYRRDDGTKQLKVLAKVGYNAESRFNELRRFEITVRDKFNNIYVVNDQQYKKLRSQKPTLEVILHSIFWATRNLLFLHHGKTIRQPHFKSWLKY